MELKLVMAGLAKSKSNNITKRTLCSRKCKQFYSPTYYRAQIKQIFHTLNAFTVFCKVNLLILTFYSIINLSRYAFTFYELVNQIKINEISKL